MAKGNHQKQSTDSGLNFEAQLWDAADKMRGYVEQLTFLLFPKIADDQCRPPFNKQSADRRPTEVATTGHLNSIRVVLRLDHER